MKRVKVSVWHRYFSFHCGTKQAQGLTVIVDVLGHFQCYLDDMDVEHWSMQKKLLMFLLYGVNTM